MPIHLFIDTNVLLSFYAYAKDDIQELTKLDQLIKNETLKLYIPMQVIDEFARNREVKLALSISEFEKVGGKALPRFLSSYPEAQVYMDAVKDLDKARNDLVQKAREAAENKSFSVDNLVAKLFESAGFGIISSAMIDQARLRRELGKPPGKNGSLGDQMNWEYLLAIVPNGTDLYILSKDGDYQSAFKHGKAHQYLIDEWKRKKNGALHLESEIKPFLNAHFEFIKLAVDKEKQAAIDLLVYSGNFAATHFAISNLAPFVDALNQNDAETLCEAAIANSQIGWILSDSDLKDFYSEILEKFGKSIDPGLAAQISMGMTIEIDELKDEDQS